MLPFFKKKVKWVPTPNFGERRGGVKPSMIVLHYTDTKDTQEAIDYMMDTTREVSAHYVVEMDGGVIQMVKDEKRAWHAGKAFWRGERDVNSHSIGVEIVNPGHSYGHEEFPDVQIEAVVKLCKRLMKKWKIGAADVLGHEDVAPGRKQDPGHLFPWQLLAGQGVGIWPEPTAMDFEAAGEILAQNGGFSGLFRQFGYDPDATKEERVVAFHRRFYAEKFGGGGDPDEVDVVSVAKVLALLRGM